MKKIIITTFILLITLTGCLFSQSSKVNDIIDELSAGKEYTYVYISDYMFSLMAQVEDTGNEVNDVVKSLTSIKILSLENGNAVFDSKFKKEVTDRIPASEYKQLMYVKEGEQKVQFLVMEQDGVIRELVILSTGNGENAIICIQGKLNLKQISKLSKTIGVEELEMLEEE